MKRLNSISKRLGRKFIIKEVINSETIKPEIKNIKIAGSNVTNDKKTIANHFNEFFTNIGPNLAKKFLRSRLMLQIS